MTPEERIAEHAEENETFWDALDALVAAGGVRIDRPRGAAHPRYPEVVYPLDYGYLEGTCSGDGDGIDVWVGSLPEQRVRGVILTLDRAKRDSEVKVLLGCTTEEARTLLAFHRRGMQTALLVEREARR
ncbi:MAG: inorganic diphosphatase [Ktedonobacterales bacterium]